MNNVVETPFVILFFVLCEVGKPLPIILSLDKSYFLPSAPASQATHIKKPRDLNSTTTEI